MGRSFPDRILNRQNMFLATTGNQRVCVCLCQCQNNLYHMQESLTRSSKFSTYGLDLHWQKKIRVAALGYIGPSSSITILSLLRLNSHNCFPVQEQQKGPAVTSFYLAGNQFNELKTCRSIAIFSFKQWHENKCCSACPKDQTWQPDNTTTWQPDNLTTWQLDTFEHRHENKSCSACTKDMRRDINYYSAE